MNKLISIFTEKNIKILRMLSNNDFLYLREISDKANIPPATVHQALKLFRNLGFIQERSEKNKKIVSLSRNNLILKKTKSLVNIYILFNNAWFKKLNRQGIVGVYGSYAHGSDDAGSDIDMWIFTDSGIGLPGLQPIIKNIENDVKREIRLMLLTKSKLERIRKSDPEFYFRIRFGSVYSGEVFD
jgi:predicted nucleotidyltransferase